MFGYDVDFDSFIMESLSSISKVPNYIYGQQLMIELYETTYKICNHLNASNPLAPVQFNEAENYLKDYLYENYLATFLYKDIGKKLNMSFDEFLDHPRYQIESMMKVINEVDSKKSKIQETMLEELNKEKTDIEL